MNKWMKKLTAALCAAVLMCGMAVTAYAGGGEEWDGLDPVEPPPMETVDPGEGFTEDGNLVTRDLLYDKATNKQFISDGRARRVHGRAPAHGPRARGGSHPAAGRVVRPDAGRAAQEEPYAPMGLRQGGAQGA